MPPGSRIPGPVPREALRFYAAKGIKPSFNHREVWAEEHGLAFTVAKVMETEVLLDVHDSLIVAIESGIPFQQWSKEIKSILSKSGWADYGSRKSTKWRLKIIYQTNLRMARAKGQWDRIEQTKSSLPNLLYGLGPSQRHRPQHESWAGLILPVDDPFWREAMPPNGYL